MNPMRFFVSIVFGLALASFAAAQESIKIMFPGAGKRSVWMADALPEADPVAVTTAEGDALTFPIANKTPASRIFVWDLETGNLAEKKVSEIQGLWKMAAADFNRIAKIGVKLEHEGKPVAVATINAQAGNRSFSRLLEPSLKGQTFLYAVPPGPIKVMIQFNADAKPVTLRQTHEFTLKRSTPEPTIAIAIAENVAVVTGEPNASNQESGKNPPKEKEEPKHVGGLGWFGSLFAYVLAIGAAIGTGVLIFRYVNSNRDAVKERLEKLGVQIPDDNAVSSTDDIPPMAPPASEPMQKIMLPDSDPGTIPVAPATPVIPIVQSAGISRLVAPNGDALPLSDGTLVIGRDVAVDLSYPDETTLSRRHAELQISGGEVRVSDLNSTNGTYVNGRKLDAPTTLRSGDVLQLGEVKFRLE